MRGVTITHLAILTNTGGMEVQGQEVREVLGGPVQPARLAVTCPLLLPQSTPEWAGVFSTRLAVTPDFSWEWGTRPSYSQIPKLFGGVYCHFPSEVWPTEWKVERSAASSEPALPGPCPGRWSSSEARALLAVRHSEALFAAFASRLDASAPKLFSSAAHALADQKLFSQQDHRL